MTASRTDLLAVGLALFTEQGYENTTLEQIAQRAKTDLSVLQTEFTDKESLFAALLTAHNPRGALESAFDSVMGESAEDIIRYAMRRFAAVIDQHDTFIDLVMIDFQVSGGSYLTQMSTQLLPKAYALLEKIKATGQLRPVSDLIMARTLASMFMGFVISERAMPKIARVAMRLFPQRAWLDGMVDLLLYGVLEDDAR